MLFVMFCLRQHIPYIELQVKLIGLKKSVFIERRLMVCK